MSELVDQISVVLPILPFNGYEKIISYHRFFILSPMLLYLYGQIIVSSFAFCLVLLSNKCFSINVFAAYKIDLFRKKTVVIVLCHL